MMSYPTYIPEWWLMPDFLFVPSMFLWTGYGMYMLWKFISWSTPTKRNERAMRRIDAEFKIKEKRQELELELALEKDRYNRRKVFYDNLNKKY